MGIYAKENLNVIEQDDLKEISDSLEIIWIEINMDKTKNIICGCAYRHPNTDISVFTNYISKCLRKINEENKLCYLSGDFNIDLLKYDSSNKHRGFLNMMTSSGFLPHIIHPIR